MLELDARPLRALGNEPHFDLTGTLRIGLELPSQVDVPTDHETVRGLIEEHASPATLAAVDAAVIDMAAFTWLEHHFGQLTAQEVMVGRPPRPDAVGEDRECSIDRSVDGDRRLDGRAGDLGAHCSSSVVCSTACLNAASALFQKPSK